MIQDTITMDELLDTSNAKKIIENKIITVEKLFEKADSINLDNRKLELFLNGVKLTFKVYDGVYRVYNNNKFIGLGVVKQQLLKRDIVF